MSLRSLSKQKRLVEQTSLDRFSALGNKRFAVANVRYSSEDEIQFLLVKTT